MVQFKDRRRQAAVEARKAAAQERANTVPDGYEPIPEDQWEAHAGQRVFHKGHGFHTLDVETKPDITGNPYTRYWTSSQISKGHGEELYKKASKSK